MKHFALKSFSVNPLLAGKSTLARKLKSELSITPLIAGFLAACGDGPRFDGDGEATHYLLLEDQLLVEGSEPTSENPLDVPFGPDEAVSSRQIFSIIAST